MKYTLGSLFDGSIEWRPIKGYENEYLVSEAGLDASKKQGVSDYHGDKENWYIP